MIKKSNNEYVLNFQKNNTGKFEIDRIIKTCNRQLSLKQKSFAFKMMDIFTKIDADEKR